MSDLDRQGWFSDAIRGLFAKLDSFVYSLISGLYQIFYYVATATIIEGETVRNFYSRVQLILGVIIMFKVAISLFNGIMNPDSLNDNKKWLFFYYKANCNGTYNACFNGTAKYS